MPYQPILNEDGSPSGETKTEIPFNLEVLRKHLAHVSLARRVLSEDLTARQKLLEDSVYDVAVERMRRQAELFKELGIGDSVLKKPDLQLWMWQWHLHLQARLKEDIARLVKKEAGQFPCSSPDASLSLSSQVLIPEKSGGSSDPSCPSSNPRSSLLSPSSKLCVYRDRVALRMA